MGWDTSIEKKPLRGNVLVNPVFEIEFKVYSIPQFLKKFHVVYVHIVRN